MRQGYIAGGGWRSPRKGHIELPSSKQQLSDIKEWCLAEIIRKEKLLIEMRDLDIGYARVMGQLNILYQLRQFLK